MASRSAIMAGRAFILLSLKDTTKVGFRLAERRMKSFGTSVKMVVGTIVRLTAAATAASVAIASIFTTSAIKKAGDMVETMNAFEATFGKQAPEVQEWGEKFAKAVGRSRQEVIDTLTSFQAYLVGMGMTEEAAAKTAKQIVSLTTDLASFRNLADSEAVRRVMSGLAGEPEAVRRLGIVIAEAPINDMLEQLGFPRVQEGATELQKAFVRLVIIMRTLSKQNALGDAVRTSGSFVNQMKRLRAELLEVQIQFGERLIPHATQWINVLNQHMPLVIHKFAQFSNWLVNFINSGIWSTMLADVQDTFDGIVFWIDEASKSFQGFSDLLHDVSKDIEGFFGTDIKAPINEATRRAIEMGDLSAAAAALAHEARLQEAEILLNLAKKRLAIAEKIVGFGLGGEVTPEAREAVINAQARVDQLKAEQDILDSQLDQKENRREALREQRRMQRQIAADQRAQLRAAQMERLRLMQERFFREATNIDLDPAIIPNAAKDNKRNKQFKVLSDVLGSSAVARSGAAARLGHNLQGGVREVTMNQKKQIEILERIDNRVARGGGGLGA